jgi:serine/threonine protein kinase
MFLLDLSIFPTISLLSKSQNSILLVHNPFSHEKYIIKKIIRKEFSHHLIDLQELFLLNALKSEHLIRIMGFNCRQYKKNNEQFFELALLMPYVGRDLSKIAEEQKKEGKQFGFDEIKRVFMQLAETMQFLHEKGVAHRDLKPENMLWNGKKVVLCDFSDSFMKNRVKDQGKTIVGTINFLIYSVSN